MVKKVSYNTLSGLYDLIILDVMLPSMNGFEILKKLREEEIESKINTSFMTFRAEGVEQQSIVNKFIPFDGDNT